jgi:hypothetical protein
LIVSAERCLVSSLGSGIPVSGATYTGFCVVVVVPIVVVVTFEELVVVVVVAASPRAATKTLKLTAVTNASVPLTNLFTRVTYALAPL